MHYFTPYFGGKCSCRHSSHGRLLGLDHNRASFVVGIVQHVPRVNKEIFVSLTLRPYATLGVALVGAGLIAVTPATAPALAASAPAVQLASTGTYAGDSSNDLVGLVLGGSGMPIPQLFPGYVEAMDELFIQRILPGAHSIPVFTPEGAQPIFSGVKSLPFDTSVAQGTTIMQQVITQQVAAGNTVAYLGYSQSTAIAGNLMRILEEQGVPGDAVKFVLIGAVNNPDGGIFERYNLTIPAFQTTFTGYAPPDTPYETSFYSLQYDGFPSFPDYPLNFLAVLNAVLGQMFVHSLYPSLTPEQIDNAIQLETTPDYDGNTSYYIIPHEELPLLFPLRLLPIVGDPLADLLNPVLKEIVNLGYDNPDNLGWSAGPANVPTGFGVLPSMDQFLVAMNNLGPAAQQGFDAFAYDIDQMFSNPSSLFDGLGSGDSAPLDLFSSPVDFINTLTGAFAQLYALGLPAMDALTTLMTTIPMAVADTFFENILSNPLDAFGLAAGMGVAAVTQVAGIQLGTTLETLMSVLGDFGINLDLDL